MTMSPVEEGWNAGILVRVLTVVVYREDFTRDVVNIVPKF